MQKHKQKGGKSALSKLKTLCLKGFSLSRKRKQWEKIFANNGCDKRRVPRTYKGFLQHLLQKQIIQFKNR